MATEVPPDRQVFKEKRRIALELLDEMKPQLPAYKALVFDAGYGVILPLLPELEKRDEPYREGRAMNALKVIQAQFLFELLVVLFDGPALVRQPHQFFRQDYQPGTWRGGYLKVPSPRCNYFNRKSNDQNLEFEVKRNLLPERSASGRVLHP